MPHPKPTPLALLILLAGMTPAVHAQAVTYSTIAGAANGDARAFGAGIGDFDGDSVPDFAVGTPLAGAGTVTIYSGSDFSILGTLSGQASGDGFGFRIATANNVFGNGKPILLVGAPFNDGGGADAGRVYLFEYQSMIWNQVGTLDGEGAEDNLSHSVASAGDVNGDGNDDVVVGAPGYDGPAGADAGRVYVLGDSGAGLGLIGNALDGSSAGGEFGASVWTAGDVSGDSREDIIAGAPAAGMAFVHAFPAGTWTQALAMQHDPSSLFGTSVRSALLTPDLVPDLIVGAPEDDHGGTDSGSVLVFNGSSGALVYEAMGSASLGFYYGYAVDVASDLDGDGVPDLLVGVPEAKPSSSGALRVLSGIDGATLETVWGDSVDDGLGECVASIGDITGDGRPEVLAGAPQMPDIGQPGPGYVRIYTGWASIGSGACPAVPNSTGDGGVIHALGSADAIENDVMLAAVQLPKNQFGYFLNSMTAGFVANPAGSQGNLCLGGAIGRYNKSAGSTGGSGSLTLVLDLTQTPTPAGPVAVQPGETWFFQCWFRDANPMPTSNFTNRVEVMFL